MGIGILYESEEWSTYALRDRIEAMGIPAKLICMEKEVSFSDLEDCELILKRSVAENGLSAYHLGSAYQFYPECSEEIKRTAVRAMEILKIETGSMDVIETEQGFYIIDVNAVSNASEDNTETFQFDLMLETAKYAVKQYKEMKEGKEDDN